MRTIKIICVVMALSLTLAATHTRIKSREALVLASVTVNVRNVVGGNPVQGTVTLNQPADEDVEVSLGVDPPDAAKVPEQVLVPKGSTYTTFTIVTPVSKLAVGGDDAVVRIYANYEVTKHAEFTVLAPVGFDNMVERVIQREQLLIETLSRMHPLIETYIQNIREDKLHS